MNVAVLRFDRQDIPVLNCIFAYGEDWGRWFKYNLTLRREGVT